MRKLLITLGVAAMLVVVTLGFLRGGPTAVGLDQTAIASAPAGRNIYSYEIEESEAP
jgi:hypothetical protein